MSEKQRIAQRLQRVRRELAEVGEQVERLARDLAKPDPTTSNLQLLGQAEVATLAGVQSSTVGVWVTRGKLPPPIAELACGRIWLKSDIDDWLARR